MEVKVGAEIGAEVSASAIEYGSRVVDCWKIVSAGEVEDDSWITSVEGLES